jgi:hypothetical protein
VALRRTLLALCLSAASVAQAGHVAELAAGKAYEDCRLLDEGQPVAYRFAASEALEFNIHRHQGADVVYPVQLPAVKALDAEFAPDMRAEWCWMWVNRGTAPVRLESAVGF